MTREMDLDDAGMEFTRSWFRNRNLETFRTYVYPAWAGQPITYLELGVFEGMSMCWMLQRVLTHPAARAVGVDPWLITTKLDESYMNGVHARADKNTSRWQSMYVAGTQTWKCVLQRGNSAEVLRRMTQRGGYLGITNNSVDLCMVDGNHNALAVVDDLRLAYQLVRPGGWLLLDDVENDHEKQDHVRQGLDSWLAEMPADTVHLLWKHKYVEAYGKS